MPLGEANNLPPRRALKLRKIEYYWSRTGHAVHDELEFVINLRFVGANGATIAQITQGYADKKDARRGVIALGSFFNELFNEAELMRLLEEKVIREVGPGPKPNP